MMLLVGIGQTEADNHFANTTSHNKFIFSCLDYECTGDIGCFLLLVGNGNTYHSL